MTNKKQPWTLMLTQEDIDRLDGLATAMNAGPSEIVHYALKLYEDVILPVVEDEEDSNET
jgi:hypothetical protein